MLPSMTHPNPYIDVHLCNRILHIHIQRPEVKNALNADMYSFMADLFIEANQSPEVSTIILQGNHQDFTAGNDLKDFMVAAQTLQELAPGDTPPFRFLKAMARCSKPVIAALRGCTIGVGVTLLFHCDLVYAHPDTEFQIPFISLGLSVEGGTSLLMSEISGYHMAADLLLTGRKFTAEEALNARLINAIVTDPEQLALEKAQHMAAMPLSALKIIKSQIRKPLDEIIQCIDDEAEIVATRLKSPEMMEAVMAFLQKRQPDFSPYNAAS